MSSRRTDQRRRRVLMEEITQTSPTAETTPTPNLPASSRRQKTSQYRAYSVKAERRHQLKTTDLIPKRLTSWLILVACLVAVAGLLNLAHFYFPAAFTAGLQVSDRPVSSDTVPSPDEALLKAGANFEATRKPIEAISLVSRNGLAAWYSSFLMILSSMASLQIYALRQHRRNDYRGTYRVWLWFAVILMISSVNCVVDLYDLVTQLLRCWTRSFDWTGSTLGLAVIKLSLLAVIIVRGLIEVRVSATSLVLVGLVWLAYSAALLLQIPSVAEHVVHDRVVDVAQGNCWLAASIMTLIATLYYARVVFMHASGLATLPLTARVARRRRRSKFKAASRRRHRAETPDNAAGSSQHQSAETIEARMEQSAGDTNEKPSPEQTSTLARMIADRRAAGCSTGSGETSATASSGVVNDRDSGSQATSHSSHKLSKAERRRMKKEKRRAA